MFGLGLLDYLKFGAGATVGALLTVYPAILVGKHEGRQQAATAALAQSVELLRKRNDINGEVSAADASALCNAMGLSDEDQQECMRRVAEAQTKP